MFKVLNSSTYTLDNDNDVYISSTGHTIDKRLVDTVMYHIGKEFDIQMAISVLIRKRYNDVEAIIAIICDEF